MRRIWVRVGVFLLIVVGIGVALKALGIEVTRLSPERVRAFVLSFGGLAPLAYLLVYGQPLVPLPGSIMTMAGGLVFGPFWGSLAALVGANIRAIGQFAIARAFGRQAVERLLKGRLARLDQFMGRHGLRAVLLVRLVPNVPFDILNYSLGLSQVRFGAYVLGSLIGVATWSFAFAYLGDALTDPQHFWKVLAAILLIAALLIGQRWLAQSRKPAA